MEHQPLPSATKLPAVTNILNHVDEQQRDSAYFSASDASSKPSFPPSMFSPTASTYHHSQTDKTPSPTTTTLVPQQPLVSPAVSNMTVASMVSPTSPASIDGRRFDRPTSLESGPNSATFGGMEPESLSRRESVDSRINQGFNEMRLGNSPYASHNQSSTSIHLTTQRTPRPALDTLSTHRISNGYQPNTERNPEPQVKAIRTAPAITGPTTSQIARAAEPTKGQAWAFPDDPRAHDGTFLDSRRSSVADSLASSHMTAESRLPPGQRRLDEATDVNRQSTPSSEFPSVHHHSLKAEANRTSAGTQPYSRTPESRQSHKMAERKRRTEMKELFDQLRDLMPQERGSKASKWEILTKAIAEHNRQSDTIRTMNSHLAHISESMELLRRDVSTLQRENQQLREELAKAGGPSFPPPSVSHSTPLPPAPYQSEPFAPAPPRQEMQPLPPLRSISSNLPNGPDSMTGVQYEPPRSAGYRS